MRWNAILLAFCCATLGLSGCDRNPAPAKAPVEKLSPDKLRFNTKLIELKNRLQKDPYSADARFGIGLLLIQQADLRGGERELSTALELGMDPNAVLPPLARVWNQLGRSKDLIAAHANTQLSQAGASAELKAALASAYASTGDSAKARAMAAAALKDDPKSARARALQAQIALADKRVVDATLIVDETLAIRPDSAELWELKADILLLVKSDAQAAAVAYDKALGIEPWNLPVHSKLITMAIAANDLATAQSRLAKLAEMAPGSLPVRYLSARLAHARGDLNAAQDQIKIALSEHPKDLRTLLFSAELDLQAGSLRSAEESLSNALVIGPRLARTRHLAAQVYLRLGAPAKAQLILEPLLRYDSDDAIALGLSAEAALQSGLTHVATQLYERAAAADPGNPRYRATLAMARIAKGDAEAGFGELESAAAIDPSTYSDMALLSARLRAGNVKAASIVAERIASKQPKRALPQWTLGQLKRGAGKLDEARAHYEHALELERAFVPAAVALAEMDLDAQDAVKARQRFEAVLAQSPNNLDALLALAEIQHRTGGASKSVTAQLENAVRLHPGQARARLALIDHLIRSGEGEPAMAAAQSAAADFPYDLKMVDALGRAQLAAGQTAQALATIRQLVTALPRAPEPLLRMADIYVRRGEPDAAISSLKDALRLQPTLLAARVKLTEIATAKQDWREALRSAREVQERFPKDARGFHLEGLVYAAQKKWEQALGAFRNAQRLAESSELTLQMHTALRAIGRTDEAKRLVSDWLAKHPRDPYFIGYLGELALLNREFAVAEEHFGAILKIDPRNVNAMNNLAWALIEQSKPGAVELARKAIALQPTRIDVQDTLSMALASENQLAAALQNQKKLVAQAPGTPDLRLNLARLAIKSKDFALARAQLDRLSALGKSYPAQAEVWKLRQQLP